MEENFAKKNVKGQITKICGLLHCNQKELAEKLGKNEKTFSSYVNAANAKISFDVMKKMSEYLPVNERGYFVLSVFQKNCSVEFPFSVLDGYGTPEKLIVFEFFLDIVLCRDITKKLDALSKIFFSKYSLSALFDSQLSKEI